LQDRVTAAETAIATKANSTDLAVKANASQLGYALIDAGTISNNNRYVFNNPFGNGTPVLCYVEVYFNNKWYSPGVSFVNLSTWGGGGSFAGYVEGEGIIIQTGYVSVSYNSNTGCGLYGADINLSNAPCRIHVWKVTN
ncbi:hypothetical protein, partial [Rosenbergiella australiborealis]|uniref:hypothetical protein n=1 Tax=Rosenbergiella australiborealis TaxID=1544696 RepID=UPI001F4E9916